jgi:16S rRNA (uracil1498-N3)-methyltransferase
MSDARIRLHLDQPLGAGQALALSPAQAHYLFGVMRLGPGAKVHVFNGRDGEWLAEAAPEGRRGGRLACVAQSAPQRDLPDLWLMFAPLKKARTDFIVEKAAELGARRILPVQTGFTDAERIARDRLQAHAVEAAEQCGGTFVPEVAPLVRLDRLLDGWDPARRILWADEAAAMPGEIGAAVQAPRAVVRAARPDGGPWAVLVGPEGGFTTAERTRLHAMPQVVPVGLGPRILRADTAAVALLTLWQLGYGDWDGAA